MFIDEVKLKLVAGKGGDGCTSFLREKFVPLGGPDGGNGGKGGSIIFKADKGLRTLIDLRYRKLLKADSGQMGRGKNQTGASAEDMIITVPIGTTIKDASTNLVICDLTEGEIPTPVITASMWKFFVEQVSTMAKISFFFLAGVESLNKIDTIALAIK